MLIFEKQLVSHVKMTVSQLEDKRYKVAFSSGGSEFSFITDQIEAIAERMAGLDHHFAMEQRAKQYEAENLKRIDDLF